ncbi:hypothetical protein HNR60_000655 [Rhodopseudomonas rhenobacensis]|uniref:Uncharacterized protein n=1 Tax=Rhodopseudomonas rhenobacensis TaxID=87461 RepID=A0A7W8DXN0_9BRAD|nr:hypothetical protein [Rhodopseudomonas rhenobacensis]MBB5045920.1 hypothetical protein [Rhodopseudomonas rhenobacensis]
MKTPAELLSDIAEAIDAMEDEYCAIFQLSSLLLNVKIEAVSGDAVDGFQRVLFSMVDHARAIRTRHEQASEIVRKLRNP